ncbi:hypothetical protein [Streptomyces sp. NPDC056227]|uniref:hypothetical protein n=1 Tax=Streptomyces sp. NPDC056227 TaxID=3345753 RepID=UPI0035DFA08B
MVEQIRKVRDLNRPGGGGWRRRRAWGAQGRLADLMMVGGPELVNEAELRHWKNHMMVELLLEFAGSAMKPDDTTKALTRMETLHAATYEDLQQARKTVADQQAAGELAAAIDDTTSLLERLEAVRDATVRHNAARDISHNDLATAMHLKSRATAQTRRRTLLKTPPGELEQWATG